MTLYPIGSFSQLPAMEPASAIFRRKAIYEELHPETKAEAFKGNQHTGVVSDNLSFTSATSDATGKDRRTVERAAARGEALGD
jgi:ParB family chromosome partitioning protein